MTAEQRKLRDEIATNATMRIVTGVIAGESPEQSDAVLIAALDRYAAAVAQPLVEALRAYVKQCSCRGFGWREVICPYCGDSTYDHVCPSGTIRCASETCIQARAALAALEGGK